MAAHGRLMPGFNSLLYTVFEHIEAMTGEESRIKFLKMMSDTSPTHINVEVECIFEKKGGNIPNILEFKSSN